MGCGCCKDDVPLSSQEDTRQRSSPQPRQARPAYSDRQEFERCDICGLRVDGSLFDGHRETCRANHRRAMRRTDTSPSSAPAPATATVPAVACDGDGDDDDNKCIICLERARTYALVPCGHVIGCIECVSRLDTCPVCREARSGMLSVALESSKPMVCRDCRHRIGPTFFDGHVEVCAMRMRMRRHEAAQEDDVRDGSAPLLKEEDHSAAGRLCGDCRERKQETALIPCGHLLCSQCAGAIATCPICLVDVQSTIKAYL